MLKILIISLLVFSISILTTNVMAEDIPTVEIILSSETYSFGDKLEYKITVSEVTNENAVLYITDNSGTKSQLLTMPIEIENTVITAQFPFDSIVWEEGTYILELEYSGASSTTSFDLLNDGSISLPFWFSDVTMMWINDEATDKDYVRNIIVQLIDEGVIKLCSANGTVLRWFAQLLLRLENHLIEGSMQMYNSFDRCAISTTSYSS